MPLPARSTRMNNLPDNDPTLRDLLRILDRRRNVFLATLGAILLVAIAVCIFMTRKYETTGFFQVSSSSADGLDLSDLMSGASSSSSSLSPTSISTDLAT